ncbi:MAG TPA: peptide-methionine (S)-S-oxide reductase MsrA [Methylomicrobium sp.]|nr:peptide-methionine (S)-S-oxide reductase MsrA [Methylomicrobium sp.]
MIFSSKKLSLTERSEALPDNPDPIPVTNRHFVNGHPILPPFAKNMRMAMFGLGCFWGAERRFWTYPNIYSTAVGYSGGFTVNPTYEQVCSGLTGHSEVVRVVYDPELTPYPDLLKLFWEAHNPTQGMRQGNDIGTQYRSGIYTYDQEQFDQAIASCVSFQEQLAKAGFGNITTEILPAGEFYYAEDYHQQYLAKNPNGYCGLGGLGICYIGE